MRTAWDTILILLILIGPIALIYAWVCYFAPKSKEPTGWRSRATLVSLVLISLAVLSWLVMVLHIPAADWGTGAGVGHQVAWVYERARVALCSLAGAIVLSLFGRPRLVLPIVIACIGSGLFWLVSTMP